MKSEYNIVPSMPPLLKEECDSAGAILPSFAGANCEHVMIAHFLSKGINCAVPEVDTGADLWIERDGSGSIVRGQVKKVTHNVKAQGRSYYDFFFQGSCGAQHSKDDTDYFYHVLTTPLRQLIWETPASIVPLREDGTFIANKTVTLDRYGHVRRKVEINYRKLIISAQYDMKVVKEYPEFFSIKNTVVNYIV